MGKILGPRAVLSKVPLQLTTAVRADSARKGICNQQLADELHCACAPTWPLASSCSTSCSCADTRWRSSRFRQLCVKNSLDGAEVQRQNQVYGTPAIPRTCLARHLSACTTFTFPKTRSAHICALPTA